MSDLTQDLLTYSKNRKPELVPCSPNEIILELVELIKALARSKKISISHRLDPAIGDIMADPQTIHRSLLNLIDNAIDACLEDENTDKIHQIKITSWTEENRWVCFKVADNGCGMEKHIQERLFDPMFSSKGGKGTGLGLLVTAKLVEEHHGKIQVDTCLEKGSEFVIKLPLHRNCPNDRDDVAVLRT